MRGYNESGKPEGINAYHMETLVADIKCLVKELGVEKFTLVAHDWGGAVAWSFAALHPELLDNLIILNLPHLLALMESRGKTWEQALKSWYIIFFQCPILPELSMLAEDMRCFARLFKDDTAWNRPLNYYRMTTTKKMEEFLKTNKDRYKIGVRTLQIFGTADTALSVGAAKLGNAYLSDGRLELLEGVSHRVQEEEPEKVNSLISNFLAE